MKFEVERAMARVRALDGPRFAGTVGERRAADAVAEEFEGLGLRVARTEVLASRFPGLVGARLGWLGAGVWFSLAVGLTVGEAPEPARMAAALVGFVWLLAASLDAFRLGRSLPPRVAVPVVVADRPGAAPAAARLVIVTRLDTPPPTWSALARSYAMFPILMLALNLTGLLIGERRGTQPGALVLPVAGWCLVVFLGTVAAYVDRRSPLTPARAAGLVGLLAGACAINLHAAEHPGTDPLPIQVFLFGSWVAVILRAWEPRPGGGGVGPGDNRTGLALLLELARAWPKGADGRVTVRFAAVGGEALDQAGSRALAADVARDDRPTLVLELIAPGFGPSLALVGRGAGLRGLTQAAADLWIPHRASEMSLFPSSRRAFQLRGLEAYSLVGGAARTGRTDGPTSVDAFALAACGQLVIEFALRWSKQATEAITRNDHPPEAGRASDEDDPRP